MLFFPDFESHVIHYFLRGAEMCSALPAVGRDLKFCIEFQPHQRRATTNLDHINLKCQYLQNSELISQEFNLIEGCTFSLQRFLSYISSQKIIENLPSATEASIVQISNIWNRGQRNQTKPYVQNSESKESL